MKTMPCKQCPQCGLYNDFTVGVCECGTTLNHIEAKIIDIDEVPPEQFGDIDTELHVFVQKCSACGALNYTDSPSNPVIICYNCHKTRVASIVPVEYSPDIVDEAELPAEEYNFISSTYANCQSTMQEKIDSQNDSDEEDSDSAKWQGILQNIQNVVGLTSKEKEIRELSDCMQKQTEPPVITSDCDFADDDVGDWTDILETPLDPKIETVSAETSIKLTEIRKGSFSFVVDSNEKTYMLGRSANQGNFLGQDGRVGNEHCYLFCKNGIWYVKDNNSKNGTAVNSRDIGQGGECILSNGDELKLGHHADSMAFRITIKK